MKNIVILGSTGSIGAQTLEVVRKHRSRLKIVGIAAYSRLETVKAQIREFRPRVVAIGDKNLAPILESWCRQQRYATTVLTGHDGLIAAACLEDADMVLSSVVGAVGLEPLLAAIKRKKDIALANKEALVVAGDCIMREVRKNGVNLFPVDSEHSAIFQCLDGKPPGFVRQLWLTASGGPFRNTPKEEFASITIERALKHPSWVMGRKITIDSATLFNKGLEMIEARWLFGIEMDRVGVVVHPQSIVHSMVEFIDGSILAQMSTPDMCLPIQYALTYPDRFEAPVPKIDWTETRSWDFLPPDFDKFPLLKLAYECQEAGGSATCTLNAADEVAVDAFLSRRIPFPSIYRVVSETLARIPGRVPTSIADILEIDGESRRQARELVATCGAAALA
jgi:1-deoxy-D-xylulose-5-phosphate reductoisomerase